MTHGSSGTAPLEGDARDVSDRQRARLKELDASILAWEPAHGPAAANESLQSIGESIELIDKEFDGHPGMKWFSGGLWEPFCL